VFILIASECQIKTSISQELFQ